MPQGQIRPARGAGSSCAILALVASLFAANDAQAQDSGAYQAALQRMLSRPSDAEASFNFARIAAEQGDLRGAITALERILVINPRLDNIRLELGVLYLRTGNTALGRQMLAQAMASPDMPDDVRIRAQEYLTAAQASEDPLSITGFVSLGARHDSNANSAPGTTVSVGDFILTEDSTGRADASATLNAGVSLRYDLGQQAGHALVLDLGYDGDRYRNETQLNLDRFSASAGIDLNLGITTANPAQLSLRLNAAHYNRDGESYLTELGGSAALVYAVDDQTRATVSAFYLDQDFRTTVAAPTNNDRDGHVAGVSLRLDRALSETSSGYVALTGFEKTARESFEAFDEVSLGVGYSKAFTGPASWPAAGPWVAGIEGQVSQRWYDGPDPVIDPTRSRSDDAWQISATLSVPITATGSLTGLVGYSDRSSNYPTSSYDNVFVAMGVTFRY